MTEEEVYQELRDAIISGDMERYDRAKIAYSKITIKRENQRISKEKWRKNTVIYQSKILKKMN